jgi:hypothetical protein
MHPARAASRRRRSIPLVGLAGVLLALTLVSGSSGGSVQPLNDRSEKLDLIDRLRSSPGTLMLGSSRMKRMDPALLRRLTGHTGFNAGVTGGTAADGWVFTRYLNDCYPGRKRYIIFVDPGLATNGVPTDLRADRRSSRYLDSTDETPRRLTCGPGDGKQSARYAPDGSYSLAYRRKLPESPRNLKASVDERVAAVRAEKGRGYIIDSARLVWFERMIAFMNRQGARPVVVFNPIHPRVLAELRKFGFPARKVSDADLRRLQRRYDFVVVDAQDIRRWGGNPTGFWDAAHMTTANARRLLAYIVSRSDGALR